MKWLGKKKEISVSEMEKEFADMMEQLGFEDRQKFQQLDTAHKLKYLETYKKAAKSTAKKSKKNALLETPNYYINILRGNNATKEVLSALRVRLGALPLKWMHEFVALQGMPLLLNTMSTIVVKDDVDRLKQAQCLHSLRMIMNTRAGLSEVLKTPDTIKIIALTLDTAHTKTRIMAFELLAALCLVSGQQHTLVMEAINNYREVKREKRPYASITEHLQGQSHPAVKIACLALINSLINCTEDLQARMHLRNQFKRAGLLQAAKELRKSLSHKPEAMRQLEVFDREMKCDEDQVMEKILDGPQENDPMAILTNLKQTMEGTPMYSTFVAILNMLAKFATDSSSDDEATKSIAFIEKLVKKMALNNQGVNFEDDELMSYILEGGSSVSSDKVVLLQKNVEELKQKVKQRNNQLKEKDMMIAKLVQRMKKMKAGGGEGSGDGDEGKTEGENEETKGETEEKEAEKEKEEKVQKEKSEKEKSTLQVKKPAETKDAKLSFTSALAGLDSTEEAATDLAPVVPVGGPGGPPPPPPMGLKVAATPERNRRHPTVKLKGFQWVKLRTRNVQNTIWLKVKFDKYVEVIPYEEIENIFAAAVIEKNTNEDTGKKSNVTIIDSKRAQNVAIMLTRFKCPHEELRKAILNANESMLDLEAMNQFIKFVPTPEDLEAIKTFVEAQNEKPEEERSTLGKAEEFYYTISDVPKLASRLQLLHFKLMFPERLYRAKPDMRKAYNAVKELRESKKMFLVLEAILILGNFINDGTFRGNASGYKIDAIIKLADTKSSTKPKYTLVHYLCHFLEDTMPELLTFAEEIPNVIEAATVSFASVASEIRELSKGLNDFEKELPTIPQLANDEEDQFSDIMDKFLICAREEVNDACSLLAKTEKEFAEVMKYYGEDKKMQPEEFFAYFKRFATLMDNAQKDLAIEKEAAERAAKRAAERAARSALTKATRSEVKKEREKVKLTSVNSSGSLSSSSGKSDDGDDISKLLSSMGADEDDDLDDNVLDDMMAMVRDGDIKANSLAGLNKKESTDSDDDDEEIEARNKRTQDLMKLMGILDDDVESIAALAAGDGVN